MGFPPLGISSLYRKSSWNMPSALAGSAMAHVIFLPSLIFNQSRSSTSGSLSGHAASTSWPPPPPRSTRASAEAPRRTEDVQMASRSEPGSDDASRAAAAAAWRRCWKSTVAWYQWKARAVRCEAGWLGLVWLSWRRAKEMKAWIRNGCYFQVSPRYSLCSWTNLTLKPSLTALSA